MNVLIEYSNLYRRVIQLKGLYRNNANFVPTESTYMTIALYLLHLLASDRIAEFHVELESISTHEQNHAYIKYPIQLERYVMEGNYAKVLHEKRDKLFDVMYARLQDAVRARQSQTRAATAECAPVAVSAAIDAEVSMSIISNMVGYAADLERIV